MQHGQGSVIIDYGVILAAVCLVVLSLAFFNTFRGHIDQGLYIGHYTTGAWYNQPEEPIGPL